MGAIRTATSHHIYNKEEEDRYRSNFDDIFGKKEDEDCHADNDTDS